ncbi:TRAP transporter substrate-binding protein DctP [Xylophilus sp. GW821-FHT01B05]
MVRFTLVLALMLSASAYAAEFRWLNSWDRNYAAIPSLIEPYIKEVEAASNGSIKINVSGPETVPPLEQLQPVAAGAFHFLYTHGAYHFGIMPLATVFEALGGDPQARRDAGLVDFLEKQYRKIGLKLVFAPMTPNGNYALILRQPPTANGDLQGRKIRATPTYNGLIRHLGATPVQLPPADIYTSLDKGVVDGAAWGVTGPLPYRWYEVSKYLLRPAIGFNLNPVLMNLEAWNRLKPEQQKILTDVGKKYEDLWYREAGRQMAEEEKALVGKGMKVVEMGPVQQQKLQAAWADGLWDMGLASKARKEVEEMRALAKAKGL